MQIRFPGFANKVFLLVKLSEISQKLVQIRFPGIANKVFLLAKINARVNARDSPQSNFVWFTTSIFHCVVWFTT